MARPLTDAQQAVLEALPSPTVVWKVSLEPVFASLAVVGPSGNGDVVTTLTREIQSLRFGVLQFEVCGLRFMVEV